MSLLNKIGLNPDTNELVTVGASFGVGKTAVLTILACECVLENKNVLYLTEEDLERTIAHRMATNFVSNDIGFVNKSKIIIKKYLDINLEAVIENQFKIRHYDVIVVDGYSIASKFEILRSASEKYNCAIIVSSQLKRNLTEDTLINSVPSKHLLMSDKIVIVTHKDKFTFWQKVKYALCFWLTKPNRTIRLLKNRCGKTHSFDTHIDFKNNVVK